MKMNAFISRVLLCLCLLPGFVLQSQNCYYKHLKGTIGKTPVTMELHSNGIQEYYEGDTLTSAESFSGTYTYDRFQEPIDFYGYRTASDMIELDEYYGQENTGKFEGSLDSDGHFNGVWKNPDASKMIPFTLAESYPEGSIAFETYCWGDSARLFEDMEISPGATNSMQLLWPQSNTPAATAAFLKKAITSGILGDSLSRTIQTPEMVYVEDREAFFKAYRSDMSEIRSDDSTVMEYPYMYSYDQQTSLLVAWNENNRLSLGYELSLYTGGAHGNYATSYLTYDLKKGHALQLKDVFLPGFEQPLSKALETAVRKKYELTEDQALTEVLFEDSITFNENFYLTGKGIVFAYVPYEIAAYAMGQIELFIPFAEISALLQPEMNKL